MIEDRIDFGFVEGEKLDVSETFVEDLMEALIKLRSLGINDLIVKEIKLDRKHFCKLRSWFATYLIGAPCADLKRALTANDVKCLGFKITKDQQ